MITFIAIAVFVYIVYRWANKITKQKDETQVSLEKPIAVMKATPKKVKEKIITKLEDSATTKPKRKYNKKPKA